jgi:hypothetical protein
METESGQWAIVEIMGRKVVAGYASQSIRFGLPMLRIDIPATSAFPAFTQEYGAQAIYAITYVSQEVAQMTAEASKVKMPPCGDESEDDDDDNDEEAWRLSDGKF